jgi:serine/threonine protein phosphatase PrpC
MVRCPHCGNDSLDRAFCEACNGALPGSKLLPLPAVVSLPDGRAFDCSAWDGAWPHNPWTALCCTRDGRPHRLYALNPGWWRELAAPVRRRQAARLDVLAPIHIVPVGDGAVVIAEGLPGAVPALPAGGEDPLDGLLADCKRLGATLAALHDAGLVWLNFDPEALLTDGQQVDVANLDLQVFPAGACPGSLSLGAAWSPPEVGGFRAEQIGPPTDVFHLSLYAYYCLANLLPGGFLGRGLEAIDFDLPPLRVYAPDLPAGIAPVLRRGCARDPESRFPTVAAFLQALEGAVASARARAASTAAVSLDAGGATAIGRTHALAGQPNQDDHRILPLAEALVAVVADGVSYARIGSGDLASRTACATLVELLPDALARSDNLGHLEAALTSCCLQASRAVLERSLAAGPPPAGIDSCELMSTTALVGVVRGSLLTLANVGDSRAYLVRDGVAEQLTVDGDVRCVRLGLGAAPDEVRDMGADATALYACLGVSEPDGRGGLRTWVERATPRVNHWPLLPGDAVVLATDGLVEENVFLDPSELAALVQAGAELPAAELARHLVEAACLLHRDASAWEPHGCGDDVTCVVIKVSEGLRTTAAPPPSAPAS